MTTTSTHCCEICDRDLPLSALRDPFPGVGPTALACEPCIAAHLVDLAGDVTLRISDGYETFECSLVDFAESNAEDAATVSEFASLAVGQVALLGGGACPVVRVERVS